MLFLEQIKTNLVSKDENKTKYWEKEEKSVKVIIKFFDD